MVASDSRMKLVIVTPTWNRAPTLEETLHSIEIQHFRPFRHVIVDNLSEDRTTKIVRDYSSRTAHEVIHLRERDQGIYDAMNKGARIAGGDALYFLNDDDRLLEPESLGLLAKCLALVPDGIAFADVWVEAPDGSRRRRNHRQMNRLTLAEKSICQQATLYTRRAFENIGPFDDTLKAAGDYDWMLRALVQNRIPAVYLRRAVAVFASGGVSSDPARAVEFAAEMDSVLRRHMETPILERAKRYRRFWRKIPWGLKVCPGSEKSDRLNVISRIVLGGRLAPDPLVVLDF